MFSLSQKSSQQKNLCLPLQQVFHNHLEDVRGMNPVAD
jgi:hypothetical protein